MTAAPVLRCCLDFGPTCLILNDSCVVWHQEGVIWDGTSAVGDRVFIFGPMLAAVRLTALVS